jgi:hexokinase
MEDEHGLSDPHQPTHCFCLQAKRVVEAVVTRAAAIIAACLTALLLKVQEHSTRATYAIATDGSVFAKYLRLQVRLQRILSDNVVPFGGCVAGVDAAGPHKRRFEVRFVSVDGCSGFGAAVLAAAESAQAKGD